MSWAETKYAINSTVGTENFEPLDKIFKGSWRFVESDMAYYTEKASYSGSSGTYTLSNSFKMHAGGTAKFEIYATFSNSDTYAIEIYKNNVLAATNQRVGIGSSAAITATASFSANDILTFKLIRKSGSGPVSALGNITICAYPIYAPQLIESM